MNFLQSGIGIAIASLATATSANAQSIDARDPAGVVAALLAAGQTAELKAGAASGNPMIVALNNQFEYAIHFTGCTAKTKCTGIYLHSSFTPPRKVTPEQIASWNAKSSSARASLSEKNGDPNLEMRLAVADGKLSTSTFIANVNQLREAAISLIKVSLGK
jgi:hypothetical protein